jgi:tetratricopeptide (TPR) repeat protein
MFLKNLVFSAIIVTFFFAGAELVLAAFGVRPLLLTEDPMVGFAENVPLFVEATGEDGQKLLRTPNNQLRLFNYQEFPKHKAENSYRIFCMGGSTTYGRPYSDRVSFCGWLRAYLMAADPSRNWEVINAGGISFASYRVARLMNELGQYEPDLFIVYTGHNEFLEQRSYGTLAKLSTWVINLNATLSGTRVYTAMSRVIDALKPDALAQERPGQQLGGEVDEILNDSAGPDFYHRDDTLKQQIITHFRLNVQRMVKIARNADAEIMFVQPVSNIKDMSPFKSEHRAGLDDQARREWQSLYERARKLQASGDPGAALTLYRQALALDDRYADLHYRIGEVLFEQGDYAAAEKAFRRAVEEDIVPLRILAPMQRIIEEVAASEDVPLIDLPALIRDAYAEEYDYSVFGKEFFRDHVHLNMEGYRLLGLALLDRLIDAGIATPRPSWGQASIEAVRQEVIAGLDPAVEGRAMLNLGKVLDWAGKHDEAFESFKRAVEILGPSPMLYDRLARSSVLSGRYDEAIRYLRETLELFPGIQGVHSKLAILLAHQGDIEAAVEHCRADLELDPTDYRLHSVLANLLEKTGDDEAALRHYKLALELKPDYEFALVKLAYLEIERGEYDQALAHSRAALRVNPEQHRAHNAIGLVMEKQGRFEQAIQHYREALRLEPDDSAAEDNLRRVRDRGMDTEAVREAAG